MLIPYDFIFSSSRKPICTVFLTLYKLNLYEPFPTHSNISRIFAVLLYKLTLPTHPSYLERKYLFAVFPLHSKSLFPSLS